jgi:formylglycine-generating enzyme required for sulfatase activity
MRRVAIVVPGICASSLACAALLGVDYRSGDSGTATGDSALADAGLGDGSVDGAPPVVRCGASGAGPAMIDAGAFCIDSTEVTQAQYDVFLTAKGTDVSGQPRECQWNTTYRITGSQFCTPHYDPTTYGNYPVAGANWCDAFAYCRWAGKRLCGALDGGGNFDTINPNEWRNACSNNGGQKYPYGDNFNALACNGSDRDAGVQGPQPVTSFPGCVGGLRGLYDMLGNVEEWVNACAPAPGGGPPENDACNLLGGGYSYSLDNGGNGCTLQDTGPRNAPQCYVGIRCCADNR